MLKLYKINNNDRFDHLLHRTNLGYRKPSELLSELRTLLGASRHACCNNADLNKLLKKLFLDKLPPQVRSILTGFPQSTLELTAQCADDIMATMSFGPSLNSNAAQLLQNQMIEQRLDKFTDAVTTSPNFYKNNSYASVSQDQQFARRTRFGQPNRRYSPAIIFSCADKCSQMPRRVIVFPHGF